MITVLAHGEDAFRLVNAAGKDVGWVRPRTIGFGGFGSEEAARAATLDGARALAACLKREFGVAHPELSDRPRLRTVRDGAGEWIVDGRARIARLLRVETGQNATEQLAIEYTLPSYATDAVAISAAQIMYGVLSRELTAGLDLRVVASMAAAAAE
jgi:hypothetical protein